MPLSAVLRAAAPLLLGARRPPLPGPQRQTRRGGARRPSDGAVDIACLRLRGAQQQTRRTLLQPSIDGTDGRTDRETDTVPLRRPRGHIGPILCEQTDSALSTATTFTFYKM